MKVIDEWSEFRGTMSHDAILRFECTHGYLGHVIKGTALTDAECHELAYRHPVSYEYVRNRFPRKEDLL